MLSLIRNTTPQIVTYSSYNLHLEQFKYLVAGFFFQYNIISVSTHVYQKKNNNAIENRISNQSVCLPPHQNMILIFFLSCYARTFGNILCSLSAFREYLRVDRKDFFGYSEIILGLEYGLRPLVFTLQRPVCENAGGAIAAVVKRAPFGLRKALEIVFSGARNNNNRDKLHWL